MCSRPLLGGMVHSYVLISRPCRSRLKDGSQPVGVAESSFTCVQRSWACLDSELLVPLGWAGQGYAELGWTGLGCAEPSWAGAWAGQQKGTLERAAPTAADPKDKLPLTLGVSLGGTPAASGGSGK